MKNECYGKHCLFVHDLEMLLSIMKIVSFFKTVFCSMKMNGLGFFYSGRGGGVRLI